MRSSKSARSSPSAVLSTRSVVRLQPALASIGSADCIQRRRSSSLHGYCLTTFVISQSASHVFATDETICSRSSCAMDFGFMTSVASSIASRLLLAHNCRPSSWLDLIAFAIARMSPIFTPNWAYGEPFLEPEVRTPSSPWRVSRFRVSSSVVGGEVLVKALARKLEPAGGPATLWPWLPSRRSDALRHWHPPRPARRLALLPDRRAAFDWWTGCWW